MPDLNLPKPGDRTDWAPKLLAAIETVNTDLDARPSVLSVEAAIEAANADASAAARGDKLLRKSAVAFTPAGWSKKGKGIAPIAALASTTGYKSGAEIALNPQWTQALTGNTMSGATLGLIGSGGALPTGWKDFQANAKKTILRSGSGVVQWRANNLWNGTWGGIYSDQTYTTATVIGVDLGISDVPPDVQVQGIFAWRNAATGVVSAAVGRADNTAAPFTSAMPLTRISVELAAPAEPSQLLILFSPLTDDATAAANVTPTFHVGNIATAAVSEIGNRPEHIPPYVPAGTYPAADAVIAITDGDYALIAVTTDRMFIPMSLTVTGGSLSLASVLGGVGRYLYIYLVPHADYSPDDLAAFLPLVLRSGLATPGGATHSRGIMHLSALVMGKRSSAFVSGVNGGSNERSAQLATGARHGRFEVHKGERDPDDGPGQNRGELSYWRVFPHRQVFGWAGWIKVESMPWHADNTGQEKYCLLLQLRYASNGTDPGVSPEVALEAVGIDEAGKYLLRLLTRSGEAIANKPVPAVNRFTEKRDLGWVYVGIEVMPDPAGQGYVKMYVNDTGKKNGHRLVVDSGPTAIGYSNTLGFRIRQGAYANNWDTARIVEHESTEFSLGLDVLSRVSFPPVRMAA